MFVRLSRSLIVNMQRFDEVKIKHRDHAELTLRGLDEPILLNRLAISRLKKQLKTPQPQP